LKISLPGFIDPDGDGVASVSVNLGTAKQFITGTYPDYTISPLFYDLGTFKISITATDNNPNPKSNTYSFTVTVAKPPVTISTKGKSKSNSTSSASQQVAPGFNAQI